MKKKTTTKNKKKKKTASVDLFTEMIGICIIGLAILVLASLFTDQVGMIGEGIRTLFVGLFGVGGYILPFIGVGLGALYIKADFKKITLSIQCIVPLMTMVMVFFHLVQYGQDTYLSLMSFDYIRLGAWSNGGWFGAVVASALLQLLGLYGTYILLAVLLGVWLVVVTQFPLFSWLQEKVIKSVQHLKGAWDESRAQQREARALGKQQKKESKKQEKKEVIKEAEANKPSESGFEHPPIIINHSGESNAAGNWIEESAATDQVNHPRTEGDIQKAPKEKINKEELQKTWDEITSSEQATCIYTYPSVELLHKKETKGNGKISSRDSLAHAKKLEDTLMSFGVEAKVTEINQGPTVTRYELQPKQGVKVSKIVNLADDIALNLAASGIRIEAPIPGKAAVGIEVPNENSEVVYLREVIDTDQFVAFPSKLAFALGRDIAGKPIITDIGKMPHMLIAGATGSGKSVCINTLITSILYKAKPSEVKLIMIDPKVVELNVYNGIPHLMIPVVTDPKKAAGALSWAVNEMTKRYQLFAENNVRDMKGYNGKMVDETLKMPNIIIIIDELADLMMTAAKEVEDAICRLAQMARAAGIHLVIATQRPSVDVITGVIKANIPSRLAFAVSSGIDSRTILDMNGAEKLLGKGDMLFYPVGESKPIRIQGAFISDKEVESIVEAVKQTGEVQYEEAIMESIATPAVQIEGQEEDELIHEAIQLTVGKDKLSISMLQRYFRIGFNRASRLMEALEARGIVGPDEGSKPRKVLQTITHKEEE